MLFCFLLLYPPKADFRANLSPPYEQNSIFFAFLLLLWSKSKSQSKVFVPPKFRFWYPQKSKICYFASRGPWEPRKQISKIAYSLASWSICICFFAFLPLGAEKANKQNSRIVGSVVICKISLVVPQCIEKSLEYL